MRSAILMGLAYATLAKLILEAATFGEVTGVVFWPGAGLTLGLLLRRSSAGWPPLLVGVFVAETVLDLTNSTPVAAALAWGVANTAEPLLGAWLLTRGGRSVTLAGARAVMRFLALAVVLGPLLGSLIGAAASSRTGLEPFWPTWPRWWVGDAAGALLIAPALFTRRRPDLQHAKWGEAIGLAALVTIVTAVALVEWPGGGAWRQGLPYLIAPTLIMVALRLGPQSSAIALACSATVVNGVTAMGIGPFAHFGTYGGLVVAQVCLAGAAIALLTVSAMNYALISRGRVEEMLREQALQDSLTGLANRRLFLDHLALAVAGLRRTATSVAVLFVDVDRFKQLNDTYGHAAGDAALTAVAERLTACVRPGDTVARLGGDEFAVVLPDVPNAEFASAVRERVLTKLSVPLTWGETRIAISASVGMALCTDADQPLDDLLNHADRAMYAEKHRRRLPDNARSVAR